MRLWKVPNDVTGELIDPFYHHVLNNEGRVKALPTAQAEIRRHYPYPYLWAAFIC